MMTQRGGNAPYMRLRSYLRQNPELYANARVYNNQRYCYATAPDLELEISGNLRTGEDWDSDPQLGKLADEVQELMQEWCYDFNREMEKQLYAEMEYHQSEEALSDSWDANEIKFNEEGEMVTQVSNGRRVRSGYSFDELSPEAKEHALDKYRYWNTEDNAWSEFMEEDLKKQLEHMGFDGVEIAYSLGYSQGDGACFTAGSVDVPKFLDQMVAGVKPTDVFNEAQALVAKILA